MSTSNPSITLAKGAASATLIGVIVVKDGKRLILLLKPDSPMVDGY